MTMEMFGASPAVVDSTPTATKHHGRRALTLGIAASAALALFLGGMGATASADPTGSSIVSVDVGSTISLTGLANHTLTGTIPGTTATGTYGYNVQSNTSYHVSVLAAQDDLWVGGTVPGTPSDFNQIPIAALTAVDKLGVPTSLSKTVPVVLFSGPQSALVGDNLTNAYSLAIPFVTAGLYQVTLNYTATTGV